MLERRKKKRGVDEEEDRNREGVKEKYHKTRTCIDVVPPLPPTRPNHCPITGDIKLVMIR